jgi:hypothetical protein
LVGKMLIVRLLARGSVHEHMMPVGECLRTRYVPGFFEHGKTTASLDATLTPPTAQRPATRSYREQENTLI